MPDQDIRVWFDFTLSGPGWARARLEIGSAAVDLLASHILGDALGALLEGIVSLKATSGTVRVSWGEEPGEFRWVLTRAGPDVDVRILHFTNWSDRRADEAGIEILSASCPLSTLARGVGAGASRVLRNMTAVSYEEQWRHPFPATALARLYEGLPT